MKARLARREDLPLLREVYGDIVRHMEQNGLSIWDEVYPVICLEEDVARARLYLLTEGEALLAAFALCDSSPGAACVRWADGDAKALYLDRLGVNAGHMRRGIGGAALELAAELAGELGAEYLRLFAVDSNLPAIRLYRKMGFAQAGGAYDEVVDADLVLHEFGFEKRVSP